jgi:dephospho-CoA kinase
MNNLRDLLAYVLDLYDVLLFRHRSYSYCQFVVSVFSDEDTTVQRFVQPLYEVMLRRTRS